MSAKEPPTSKPGRTFDSAYSFSFAIALGLILFIAGLVISLTLGEGTSIGLVFGIPLLLAGLILPLFMMRDLFTKNDVAGACPYCGAPIKTSDATIRLECPACNHLVGVREEKFYQVESTGKPS
ncbi:MAG: hypothetical protein M3R69_08085 [Acidobacteriota bacterium]|nr:hypothetical protein [Acidobacteriota bacterium]